MYYSVLIYAVEGVFERLPPEEQETLLAKHRELQRVHRETGTLGPVLKLMGTSAAVTVRQSGETVHVTDGPFAETKEQLLGLYILECDTIDQAIEAARQLPGDVATYEIRPIEWAGGSLVSAATDG
jgi:hypothetical protein